MSRAARERPRLAVAAVLVVLLLLGAGALGATLAQSEPQTPPDVKARVQRLEVAFERQQRSLDAARSDADQRASALERAQERVAQLRRANTALQRQLAFAPHRASAPNPQRTSRASRASRDPAQSGFAPAAPPAAPVLVEEPRPSGATARTIPSGGEFEP